MESLLVDFLLKVRIKGNLGGKKYTYYSTEREPVRGKDASI